MTDDITINYRHFFQNLLEAAPWPVLIIDRTLTIRFYSQLACQLFGTSTSLQDVKLDQLMEDEAMLELVQKCIETGSSQQGEHDKRSPGVIWKISITPLDHQQIKGSTSSPRPQDYQYFALAIEDLTELRRLERVRRDFIANISHELRTPLASVRLLAETLEEAIDTDRDKAQTFVEKIETEVHYLTNLVSELLELSRIESGQVSMLIEPVEAEQLVREVMARMLPLAQRHRVMLRTDIQQGKTLVAADSKQAVGVLVNLVHNAIKFTPSGGVVVIGTILASEGRTQQFFVRDTGVGIRAEELPRIFERFYKADRARSRADFIGPGGKGSGLGLDIARHVGVAHGGSISAESVVGNGSTFTFTLPVAVRNNVQEPKG